MEILKCENVRKVYGARNNQVVALDHINLSAQKKVWVVLKQSPEVMSVWQMGFIPFRLLL